MDIEKIIPYARNARDNKAAIPVVADSIREFGLRGQIVLESRDNPVIVTGHTRVAACKSLGWTEIPDENIAYCDGLTEDQIKAYRLADNKTGEVAKWNRALERSEVRELMGKGLDMSRFAFDFKSKGRTYGAERLRTDDAYNLSLCNRFDCNESGYPSLPPVDARPGELQGFNYAKSTPDVKKRGKACHFFIDDYQFERVWNKPEQYLNVLSGYDCVLQPDFSMYLDMPEPMQAWSHYRNQMLAWWWSMQGLTVVPSLSWAQKRSYTFAFEGVPKHSTVAVSTVGIKADKDSLRFFQDGMGAAMEAVQPSRVLLYGGSVDFDFGGVEVVEYKNGVTERMANGR